MSDHIEFDEMADFLFEDNYSEAFIQKSKEIDAHIQHCRQCYDLYETLLTFKETLEDELLFAAQKEKLESYLYKRLDRLKSAMTLKIQSGKELLVNEVRRMGMAGGFDFRQTGSGLRPALSFKSTDSDISAGDGPRELVDTGDPNNRITYDEGLLQIRLSKKDYKEPPMIMIERQEQESLIQVMKEVQEVYRADFQVTLDGDYRLLIF